MSRIHGDGPNSEALDWWEAASVLLRREPGEDDEDEDEDEDDEEGGEDDDEDADEEGDGYSE